MKEKNNNFLEFFVTILAYIILGYVFGGLVVVILKTIFKPSAGILSRLFFAFQSLSCKHLANIKNTLSILTYN